MAIVNATPDSFSGDGIVGNGGVRAASEHALRAVDDGADLIDIGGVPTFPGAAPVAPEEERARVAPTVRVVRDAVSVPISVDTCTASVARAALEAGADLVNSAWGLRLRDGGWNTELAEVVAEHGVRLVLTHNRSAAAVQASYGGVYTDVHYRDVVADVLDDLRAQVDFALAVGVAADRLIVDFGLGLGKTPEQNLTLLGHLADLRTLGCPTLLAHSRKSFIGHVTGGPPASRDGGTAALTALGIAAGIDMVRVHNVPLNRQAALMADRLHRPAAAGAPA
ncbi:dihydropteroate synthase [Streptomyces sp. NPDC019224]|uniref:dihydropteroate synthase n=1 Tax=Streptomyces sp. NPDC019224 TaxID=3154484 RepID=UPI0033C8163D